MAEVVNRMPYFRSPKAAGHYGQFLDGQIWKLSASDAAAVESLQSIEASIRNIASKHKINVEIVKDGDFVFVRRAG
jgi:hypothetical protein